VLYLTKKVCETPRNHLAKKVCETQRPPPYEEQPRGLLNTGAVPATPAHKTALTTDAATADALMACVDRRFTGIVMRFMH
jgi:hypothetical protein